MLDVLGLGELTALQAAGDVAVSDPQARGAAGPARDRPARRDFETADRLREQLRERGWEIRDGPDGSELVPSAQP